MENHSFASPNKTTDSRDLDTDTVPIYYLTYYLLVSTRKKLALQW